MEPFLLAVRRHSVVDAGAIYLLASERMADDCCTDPVCIIERFKQAIVLYVH